MTGQVHLTGQAWSQYPDRPVRMQAGQLWEPDFQEGVGRTIKAARDIQIGEIVLEDSALLAVPDGFPVCLGCLGRVDGSFLCAGCGCPLCSDDCAGMSAHKAECELLAINKVIPAGIDCGAPHGLYAVLAVVRACTSPDKRYVVAENFWVEILLYF